MSVVCGSCGELLDELRSSSKEVAAYITHIKTPTVKTIARGERFSLLQVAYSDSTAHRASYSVGKGKRKAFPLQTWTGLWDSRRLRLQNFSTIGT